MLKEHEYLGASHIPTREECSIIRQCAMKSAGIARIKLEIGERCYVGEDKAFDAELNARSYRGSNCNIALLQPEPDWDFNDTDLADHMEWSWWRKRGFHFTPDGTAIVDFYVYSLGYHGELETNVTAYWRGGKMVAVYGTMNGCMWGERLRNCT